MDVVNKKLPLITFFRQVITSRSESLPIYDIVPSAITTEGGAIMRKLKNVLNTVAFKSLSMVAAAAFMVTATNVNTCCWYYFGQDELLEEARKLRRF